VQRDKNCGGQVRRQASDQLRERFNAASRGADYYDVGGMVSSNYRACSFIPAFHGQNVEPICL
jgi:hypothetical protein